MVQLVYVLEIVRNGQLLRVHFAQAPKAAMRAVQKHGLSGTWVEVKAGQVVAELQVEGEVQARVVREEVEYS